MFKIYGDRKSGNCYKIQLTASILELDYEWVEMDILAGDTQQKGFISKNPNGKIPLLELADGRCLSESNAIINFIATDSFLLPQDQFRYAQMLQWQFFEQYSHEPYVAVARFINKYLSLPEPRLAEYKAKQQGGYKALAVMEKHLKQNNYFVGESISLADISLYAYTHVADEGGFELADYLAIQGWLKRIAEHPGYSSMIA